MKMLESVTGNALKKAQALGIPLAGDRDAKNGKFCGEGVFAILCSSSEFDSDNAHCAYLGYDSPGAFSY